MLSWSVVEDGRKAKIFSTKKEAMTYFTKRKKTTHKLMAVYHYKNDKWVGVRQN